MLAIFVFALSFFGVFSHDSKASVVTGVGADATYSMSAGDNNKYPDALVTSGIIPNNTTAGVILNTGTPITVLSYTMVSQGIASKIKCHGATWDNEVASLGSLTTISGNMYNWSHGLSSPTAPYSQNYTGDLHCYDGQIFAYSDNLASYWNTYYTIEYVPYDTRIVATTSTSTRLVATMTAGELVDGFFLFMIVMILFFSFLFDRIIGVRIRKNTYNSVLHRDGEGRQKTHHD